MTTKRLIDHRETDRTKQSTLTHNYSAWSITDLTELAISYCHRMELWPLPKEERGEFDAILAELDFRGTL